MTDKFLITDSFIESISSFDKNLKASLWKCLGLLGKNCFHPSLNTEKLNGLCSSRINIDYRVIHEPLSKLYRLLYAGKHDDAYRFAANYREQIHAFYMESEIGEVGFDLKSRFWFFIRVRLCRTIWFFITERIWRLCRPRIQDGLVSDKIYSLRKLKRYFS